MLHGWCDYCNFHASFIWKIWKPSQSNWNRWRGWLLMKVRKYFHFKSQDKFLCIRKLRFWRRSVNLSLPSCTFICHKVGTVICVHSHSRRWVNFWEIWKALNEKTIYLYVMRGSGRAVLLKQRRLNLSFFIHANPFLKVPRQLKDSFILVCSKNVLRIIFRRLLILVIEWDPAHK